MAELRRRLPRTRERILDAAFELFVERAYDGVTVTEVERRVGLAEGTGSFYRHFSSKEALLRAVIEHRVAQLVSAMDAEWAELVVAGGARPSQLELARLLLERIRRFEPLMRILIVDGHRVPDLQQLVASAFRGNPAVRSWVTEPASFLGVAALMGYHVFGLSSDLVLPAEDAFLEALVSSGLTLLQGSPPDGPPDP